MLGKKKDVAKKVASVVVSVVIVLLCILVYFVNKDGKSVSDIKDDIKKMTGIDNDSGDGGEDTVLENYLKNNENVCDYVSEKYINWEEAGYLYAPTAEYDRDNLIMDGYAYGVPYAEQNYLNELGKAILSYEDEYLKNAPDYAVENGEFKEDIFGKDWIKSIGEEMCYASKMCDITVDSISFSDNVEISDRQYVIFNDLYDIVDEETGVIGEAMPDDDYSGDTTGLGELCYMEVEVSVKCNCPWVTYIDVSPTLTWLNDEGEYLALDGSVARPEIYVPRIGYDGLPVYSESYNQNMGYPVANGETYTFKYGYIVDKASLDNLYIEIHNNTEGANTSASRYLFLVKAV